MITTKRSSSGRGHVKRWSPTAYERTPRSTNYWTPFPDLIELDRAQARERLPGLQELCERVLLHTDRKGTSGAPQRWWKLLAKADPVAVAEMAAPELLANCNLPSYRLTRAIRDLWEEQQSNSPAHIAAALRLAIRPGLTAGDATCLSRLVGPVGPSTPSSIDWFRLVLSRVDERPTSYAVTDSQELVDRDSEQVDTSSTSSPPWLANRPFYLVQPVGPLSQPAHRQTLKRQRRPELLILKCLKTSGLDQLAFEGR